MSKVNRRKYKVNEENVAKLMIIMKKLLHYCKYNNNHIDNKESNVINTDSIVSIDNTDSNVSNTDEETKEIICEQKFVTNCDKKSKPILNVPVIIGGKSIDVPLQSKVTLKEWTSQIKEIKSNVQLVDSKVIKIKSKESNSLSKKGKLFIKGILKNNIEYTSIDNTEKNCINGSIKYTTIYIPFHCTTLINFTSSQVYFNKSIYCDIKDAQVIGSNLYTRKKNINKIFIMDKVFKEFEQKIVLKLTLSLTQEQQIK